MVRLAQTLLFLILMSFAASTFATPKLTPMVRKAALYSMLAKELNQPKISPAVIDWFYRKAKDDYDRRIIRKTLKEWHRRQAVKFYGSFDGLTIFESNRPFYRINIKQSKNKKTLLINNKEVARLSPKQGIYKSLSKGIKKLVKVKKEKNAWNWTHLFFGQAYAQNKNQKWSGIVDYASKEIEQLLKVSVLVVAADGHEFERDLKPGQLNSTDITEQLSEIGFNLPVEGEGLAEQFNYENKLSCEPKGKGKKSNVSGVFKRLDGEVVSFTSSSKRGRPWIEFKDRSGKITSTYKSEPNTFSGQFYSNIKDACLSVSNTQLGINETYLGDSQELRGGLERGTTNHLMYYAENIKLISARCEDTFKLINKEISCLDYTNSSKEVLACFRRVERATKENHGLIDYKECFYDEKLKRRKSLQALERSAIDICDNMRLKLSERLDAVRVLDLDSIQTVSTEKKKDFNTREFFQQKIDQYDLGNKLSADDKNVVFDALRGQDYMTKLDDHYIKKNGVKPPIDSRSLVTLKRDLDRYISQGIVSNQRQKENQKIAFALASLRECCGDKECSKGNYFRKTLVNMPTSQPAGSMRGTQ